MGDPPVTLTEPADSDMPPALIRVKGSEQSNDPVIIQPYENRLWGTTKRLQRCDIYALPDDERCWNEGWFYDVFWWMQMFDRDVTLWPIDIWSAHAMTTVVQHMRFAWTPRERSTFKALRWAWGSPLADELGQEPAEIETLWKRREREQKAA